MSEIAQWGIGFLILDGGEPLCRDDFYEIVSFASNRGIRVVVGSNETLIDLATANRMKRAGIQAVAISIDGADAQTHDTFRGEEGSFKRALEGAESCKRANLPFQFNMVRRKQNISQLSEMIKLNIKYGSSE